MANSCSYSGLVIEGWAKNMGVMLQVSGEKNVGSATTAALRFIS